jgi:acyl carrier protein
MDSVNDDGIKQRVIAILAAALDRKPADIVPSVSLQDLGAESLDFLDVAFRLEKEFGIRMPRLNVLQRAEEHFGAGVLVADGVLTTAGLEIMRKSMPEVDPARLTPGLRASEVGTLLSADTFVRIVRRMLAATREMLTSCPACGGALEESATTREAICSGCKRSVPFPAGDDVLLQDLIAIAR